MNKGGVYKIVDGKRVLDESVDQARAHVGGPPSTPREKAVKKVADPVSDKQEQNDGDSKTTVR